MYRPMPFWKANTARVSFYWVPWNLNTLRDGRAYGWLRLPGGKHLTWGLEADHDERTAWAIGPLALTRPETPEEEAEREAAWEEEAQELAWAEEDQSDRYAECYY